MAVEEMTELTDDEKATLYETASALVAAAVYRADPAPVLAKLGDLAERSIHGVFVTVKRGETLRGCCGRQGGAMRLGEALAESAARTARDPRMAPLAANELPFLELSVSLLGANRPIHAQGAAREGVVKIGTHGLRIQMAGRSGLLLPQVAVEQGWDAAQFLDAVCRKAGLPAGSWQSDQADVQLFDGIHFGGDFVIDPSTQDIEPRLLSPQELVGYRDWVKSNLVAIQTGATPMYYAMGLSDLEVLGVAITITPPAGVPLQKLQLSIKDSRPLQSTLYQMTDQAVRELVVPADQCGVELAVLDSCIHHGGAAQSDLRGIDSSRRAVLVTDGRRWAIRFDTTADVTASVASASGLESFRGGEQLYSLRCDSTANAISVSVGPRAVAGVSARPPAVAGRFYAADDAAREAEVDALICGLPEIEVTRPFAAMVPHAGLRFSGRVAADVWRRIEPAKRVLMIGPKHTADGMDWAVAPHDRWLMTRSASIEGDVQTARDLAERIPGLELDAGAHAREHGIEIQLPLMHRFCPDAKLTAIAMSGGAVEQLQQAAKALAAWIREQPEPPLLVVSSDMNHYAEDAENRRRDRLALDSLATGDGSKLLDVCGAENISMCGQVPAAWVLMTMRELGMKSTAMEIAYATSADSGGDPSRVVGYAGVLWE
ncbi:MAG: AmmeMemoRadiSam system protein B [Planctomycetota bacterium]